MRNLNLLPLIYLFIGVTSMAADDCSPVRLDAPGGSMEHVMVRDQIGGTCFFETATQLFDAYRFKHGADTSSNSSGFMAALASAKANGKSTLDNDGVGGFVCDAFEHLTTNGAVSLEHLTNTLIKSGSDISTLIYDLESQRKDYQKRIEAARSDYFITKFKNQQRSYQIDDTNVTRSSIINELIRNEEESEFMEKVGNEILEQTVSMAHYYLNKFTGGHDGPEVKLFFRKLFLANYTQVKFIEMVLKSQKISLLVENKIAGHKPSCNVKWYNTLSSNHDILKDLNHTFSNGKKSMPISINFCSNVYEGGRKFNPGTRTFGTFYDSKNCGQHAVILLGRKRNPITNRCQYLIRNSFGTNICADNLSKDWTCEREIGAQWIDADKIAETTGRIEYIR